MIDPKAGCRNVTAPPVFAAGLNFSHGQSFSGAGARTLTALYDFWSKVGLLPDPVAGCVELGTRVEI
jgi:hypothetical protein